MPPKKGAKGGKKGAKVDDDAHWEALAAKLTPAATPPPTAPTSESDDDTSAPPPKPVTFASLGYDDIEHQEGDDDEGGLMAMMAAAKSNKKKDKKKPKQKVESEDEEEEKEKPKGIEQAEVDPDSWMEDEFGPTKPKKGKKGGKKVQQKKQVESDDEVEAVAAKVDAVKLEDDSKPVEETPVAAEDEDEEPKEGGVLSKKEKERIKKEKEKAKKKAQAAAKKAQGASTTDTPAPVTPSVAAPPPPAVSEPTEEADDGADDGGEGAGSKNKKKKKKKTAAEKVPEVAAPKKGGAGGAQMAMLRAAMEARKAAQEEADRMQREEQERIEAEERRLEEEEAARMESKAAKKEKEKAKKEQLKKAGLLLTPKQKAEKAAAEIRRQALLGAQGVTIAGLQPQGESDETPAPRAGFAKKKPANKRNPHAQTPVVAEAPGSVEEKVEVEEKKEEESDGDVKDDWDASSDEEAKPVEKKEEPKDDWDASDEEEAEKVEIVKPKAAPAPAKAATNGKAAPAPVKSVPTKGKPAPKTAPAKGVPVAKGPAGKGKAAVVEEESSSEEDSDDDSDDDDDSGSDDDDSDDDSDEDSDDDSEDEVLTATQKQLEQKKAEAKVRRLAKNEEALKARSKDNMRSPICVILGHVDTGKTKLLDKIRQTNVQEGEAGGITQQIGATYFPMEAIKGKTAVLGDADLKEYKLPGLLVIDTPGHESFTNLRTRGSSLCNIAILVVDIMHGLEPQTLESLRLLRDGKTPFIVALNKIDRLYGWKPIPDGGFQASLAAQHESVQREFKDRLDKTILAFAEQGLNSLPYYQNKDFSKIVSLVPTSAHTGEGVPDMLMLIIKLTQERMTERLMYLSTLECTVLEVKVIEGLGTTIDVVLSNGVLHEGDRIVVCGLNGPISTQVRALLTPQPMKELRIKVRTLKFSVMLDQGTDNLARTQGQYVHHKEVKASLGIKIVAPDLEKAIAGSRLLVIGEDDDEDELREEVMSDLTDLMNSVDKSGRGVCVQASTLGSLEALLEFLRTSKIPVSGINIGPVHRKDVMRAASMLEKAKELAVILCFDVAVDKEAEKVADELGIKIFKADIIYHLFDAFTAYNAAIVEAKRVDSAPKAVFPCRLKIIQAFAKRDPIIVGCDIIEGTLRVGTPMCVVRTDPETKKKEIIGLGKVTSLEINHKVKQVVKKSEVGGGVAVKIEHASYESAKQYGRHFDDKDELISMISRASIDVLKTHFRNDVSKEDWLLIKMLKTLAAHPSALILTQMSMLFSRSAGTTLRAAAPSARAFSSTPAQQATLRELEMRIKSVGNIGKITKSMKMVAASRLAKAQKAMKEAKEYGVANNSVFEQSEAAKSEAKVEKILYITIASDRGLCGGIHSSVAKATKRDIEAGEGVGKQCQVVVLGEKPKQQLTRGAILDDLVLTFNQIGRQTPTFADALAIADKIEQTGLEYDKASHGSAKNGAGEDKSAYCGLHTGQDLLQQKAMAASPSFAAYEVEGDELAADLSSFAMANVVYAGLVEGYAAEVSSRRNAMDNASKNATEMIEKLQMKFNRMRQAQITNELVDIITGASAL
ncbi:translation initiation factor 5B, partial [Phenoliferia sp. Uapishka_3]